MCINFVITNCVCILYKIVFFALDSRLLQKLSIIYIDTVSGQGCDRKTGRTSMSRSWNISDQLLLNWKKNHIQLLNNSRFGEFVHRIHPIELEIKIPQIQIGLLYTWTYTSKWNVSSGYERIFTTKEMISIFPLCRFHSYVAIFQQHLHMEYISLSWYDIPELVVPIRIPLIDNCC